MQESYGLQFEPKSPGEAYGSVLLPFAGRSNFVTDETFMDLKYGWCFFHQWVVSFSTSIALDDYHFFVTAPAEGVLLIFRAIFHLPLEIICFATTVMN